MPSNTTTAIAALAVTAGAVFMNEDPSPIDSSLFTATGEAMPEIDIEAVIATDPMTAWRGWVSPDVIDAAMGVETDFDLRIGGKYEYYFGADLPEGLKGSEDCQILSYVPGQMLSFSWNAPPSIPETRDLRTWVVVTFSPETSTDNDRAQTRIRLQHIGFGPIGNKNEAWAKTRAYFEAAWPQVLAAHREHFAED
ncbi:MAG: SRPBCC domain-containing protein [Planctomycetota bacterium]